MSPGEGDDELWDLLPDGVVIADADGVVIRCNAEARRVLGDWPGADGRLDTIPLQDIDGLDWYSQVRPFEGLVTRVGIPAQTWTGPTGEEVLVHTRLVRDGDLPGANAARSAVTAIGVILGPALGGVLLLVGSPATAFGVNAATFGVAVVFTAAIRDRRAFAVTRHAAAEHSGLVSDIADGAAALRAHPAAIRLIGADILCSLVYGMQTVLLLGVAQRAGLGLHGYGYLFAAIGVGGLAGTSLASRVARLPHHVALAGSLTLVGLPMLALPVAHWAPAALCLAGFTGAGALCVEIMAETGLQRMLDDEVFGRAYGLALPASIAGIAVGSVVAPALVSAVGLTAALLACEAARTMARESSRMTSSQLPM